MGPRRKRRVPSARTAAVLKGMRRLHLYCGLVMLPWVILYAVSGLLFNHPGLSGGEGVHRFTVDDLPPRILAEMPEAPTAVADVLEQVRQHAPHATIEPLSEPTPSYVGSLRARGTREDGSVGVFVGMESGNGAVRRIPDEVEPSPPGLAEVTALSVESLEPAIFEQMARSITEQHMQAPQELSVSSAPELRFGARVDGEPWVLTFDPHAGTLAYEPFDHAPDVRMGRVLARLHMTHVYPASFGARWVHALIVDLTIVCLLLWCLTGMVMWWQLRRLRRIGWVFVLSGLAATTWLLVLIWPQLVG